MTIFDYEWDERKNRANLEKHGLSFDLAVEIFAHPVLLAEDPRRYETVRGVERRYIAIGEIDGVVVIVVVYTWRGEKRRIVSARKANRNERKAYKSWVEAQTG
ncbi:MAG: hypothetical protein AMXMBFR74_20670 [Parvibaculum sp.]|jgi:hypothetical protein|uniref:BrnT family toxin n=1 Tax=Parvibaculum sp. TaxID=2024848 RepID=UPI0035B80A00